MSRRAFLLALVGSAPLLFGCSKDHGQSAAPEPRGPSTTSTRPAAPMRSAEVPELPPFEKRFQEVGIDELARAYESLPKYEHDLERHVPGGVLQEPQIPMRKVVGGRDSLCGLSTLGAVHCWGGELQSATLEGTFTDVAAGDDFVCATSSDGKLLCSARAPGRSGEAGAPVSNEKQTGVVAQGTNLCALADDGGTRCWSKSPGCDLTPPNGDDFSTLAVSAECFACGVRRGGPVECWGRAAPKDPPSAEGFVRLAAGDTFVCAVRADGKTECFGERAPSPDKSGSLVARGHRACWLDADHQLRCNDSNAPRLRGAFVELAMSASATCGLDSRRNWACAGKGNVQPPVDPQQLAHPTWAPTPEERQDKRRERTALLAELAKRFPERPIPSTLDRNARFVIGPFVETRYLPLLRNIDLTAPLSDDAAVRHWRYGFRLVGGKSGTQLVLAERGALELYSFDDHAELVGHATIVARKFFDFSLEAGCVHFSGGDIGNEELIESSIDATGQVKIHGHRARERKAIDPSGPQAAFECITHEMTAALALSPWHESGGVWQARTSKVSPLGCAAAWPLGAPFWVKNGALPQDQAASALLPSCVTP
jgi:hypothetical protein